MIGRKSHQRGQSMIELLVGILVVSMVMVVGVLLAARSVQLHDVATKRQKAVELAKSGIENLREQRNQILWSQFVNGVGSNFTLRDSENLENNIFLRRTYLSRNPATPDQVSVRITIDWSDVKGSHVVTQETILTAWQY